MPTNLNDKIPTYEDGQFTGWDYADYEADPLVILIAEEEEAETAL